MNLILETIEFFWALLTGLFSRRKTNSVDLRSRDILIVPGLGAGELFYKKLEKRLAQAGYRPYIVGLPIWKSEKQTLAHLTQALKQSGNNVIVIAHNTAGILMGGLPDPARRKVDTLITLGTPYKGFKLFGLFSWKGWEPGAQALELRLPAYLFINRFHPLSPIQDYLFFPREENLQYGQGRDQWFDIPGNYNLVRRKENLRTIVEYLHSINPPIPLPPVDTVIIKDTIVGREESSANKSLAKSTEKSLPPQSLKRQYGKSGAKPKKSGSKTASKKTTKKPASKKRTPAKKKKAK